MIGNPIRIAVFSYRLPVEGEKRGGIERVAHDLADGLARRGHEVTVWAHDPKPEHAVYEVRRLPWGRFVDTWLGRRLTMGYLGNLLAALPDYGDVELIISHGDSLLLPLRGKPVLRVMHGSALGEALSATSLWRFVMQVGVYVQELLTGLLQPNCIGVSNNTARDNPFVRKVIPNGVALEAYYPDPRAKTTNPSILFVGALGGRKRGALLIKWFKKHVRARHPNATLTMVSLQGPPEEGVSYHSGLSTAALAEMYRSAWVYATPSTYEGFGLPYVEAMASGTPVVASRNAGSAEVLGEGQFGLLVGDEEFGKCLAELLVDRRKREELTANGLVRAKAYSLEKMIDSYEELILEICRGHKAEPSLI